MDNLDFNEIQKKDRFISGQRNEQRKQKSFLAHVKNNPLYSKSFVNSLSALK